MSTTRSPRHTASRTVWVTNTMVLPLSRQMLSMASYSWSGLRGGVGPGQAGDEREECGPVAGPLPDEADEPALGEGQGAVVERLDSGELGEEALRDDVHDELGTGWLRAHEVKRHSSLSIKR